GGGTGPATGTAATTCTPGEWNLHRMLEAIEEFPVNLGLLGKGNASAPGPLREQIEAGAVGLKLHEDWGTTPAAIDTALAVAEEHDVQVAIDAEEVLHDLGAISMMSSDSQAMGRIGEVIVRTWQTADKMKLQRGPLPGENAGDDNRRVKRYVAKYTINPAIAHGLAEHVGSI